MKKRILAMLIALSMVFSLLPTTLVSFATDETDTWETYAATSFAGGSGTESDPYQIATAEQLAYFGSIAGNYADTYGQYFVLTADIDISAYLWNIPSGSFCGTLDGANHIIKGLTITDAVGEQYNVGFLQSLSASASVKNITFTEVSISLANTTNRYLGTLCGTNNGDIRNVTVESGSISGGYYVGGIAGAHWGDTITNCVNKASVHNTGLMISTASEIFVGGIVATGTTLFNCSNTGTISMTLTELGSSKYLHVGGLAGDIDYIQNSYNTGSVSCTFSNEMESISSSSKVYMGGLAGDIDTNSGLVSNSYNTGNVTLEDKGYYGYTTVSEVYVAGLVGVQSSMSSNITLENCYNSGIASIINYEEDGTTVTEGQTYICGALMNATYTNYGWLTNCYWASGIGYTSAGEKVTATNYGTFDASGNLTAEEGTLLGNTLVGALNAGRSSTMAEWEGTGTAVTLKYVTADLTGTLTDSTGAAVSGATVSVSTMDGVKISSGISGSDGTYTVTGLDLGEYAVDITGEDKYPAMTYIVVTGEDLTLNTKLLSTDKAFSNNTITTPDELAYFAAQVTAGNTYAGETILLGSNIDMSGYLWKPIVTDGDSESAYSNTSDFYGDLNGQGYAIQNLTVRSTLSSGGGLFLYLDNSAYTEIKNITFTDPDIYNYGASAYAGALAGRATYVSLSNITVSGGSVTSEGNYAGAVVGYASITPSTNLTNVGTAVTCSFSSGQAGGIFGSANAALDGVVLSNLSNSGTISGYKAGGLVGSLYGNSTNVMSLENSENTGTVSGSKYVGGLAGTTSYANLENCENNGTVTSGDGSYIYVGGLVGDFENSDMTACFNYGAAFGDYVVGGLVGYSYYGTVRNSANYGDVTIINGYAYSETNLANVAASGLVGGVYSDYDVITNCFNAGAVSYASDVTNFSGKISGLAAMGTSATMNLSNCYNIGTVSADGASIVYNVCDGILSNCFATTTPLYTEAVASYGSYELTVENVLQVTDPAVLLTDLNDYTAANAINNLTSWVIEAGVNNGYPVFAPAVALDFTVTGSDEISITNADVRVYSLSSGELLSNASYSDGVYTTEALSGSAYMLEVSADGYADTRYLITAQDEPIAVNLIKLEPLSENNEGVYEISSIGQLAQLAQSVNNCEEVYQEDLFRLTADLDLGGYYWIPIGSSDDLYMYGRNTLDFGFYLDGNGYTISNLTIYTIDDNQGLFGFVSESYYENHTDRAGNFYDLTLADVNIVTTGDHVGALVANAEELVIDNITVTGTISGGATVGGIAGEIESSGGTVILQNSTVDATIISSTDQAEAWTGGIVGYIWDDSQYGDGTIILENLEMSGYIDTYSGWSNYVGGIAGAVGNYSQRSDGYTAYINNLTNNADIDAVGGYVGGVIGYLAIGVNTGESAVVAKNLQNNGNLTSDYRSAGIIYTMTDDIALYNSVNYGTLSGGSTYGITSSQYSDGITIENCWNAGGGTYTRVISDSVATGTNYYLDTMATGSNTKDGDTAFTAAEANTTLLTALNNWVNNTDTIGGMTAWSAGDVYPIFAKPATVTYNANGGMGEAPVYSGDTLYVGGQTTALAGDGLSKTDYNFMGWSFSSTDFSTIYEVGDVVPLDSERVTLYAVWAKGLENATASVADSYTYTGEALEIDYTIMESGSALTEGEDYTVISIQDAQGDTVEEIVNAGAYTITIEGMGGYYGEVTIDLVTVAQQVLTIVDTDYSVSKVYDNGVKATSFDASIATNVNGITVEVVEVSDYTLNNVSDTYEMVLTFGEILGDDAANYMLESDSYVFKKGEITPFVITQVGYDNITITKEYDGTVAFAAGSGQLVLMDAEGNEAPDSSVILNFSVGNYATATAEENKTVTITLGSLADNSSSTTLSNYELDEGLSGATYQFTSAVITKASYKLQLSGTPEIKYGTGVSVMEAAVAALTTITGVGSEQPVGTMTYYSDSNYTEQLVDSDLTGLVVGATYTVYYMFELDLNAAVNSNYTETESKGSFNITVVDGDPQVVAFAEAAQTATYGDATLKVVPTVTDSDGKTITTGGAVTYASSNTAVATVAADGTVTIVGAGSTTITATAAAVTGEYAEGSGSYTLTVNPKTITVTADDATRVYGEADPTFGFTVTASDLVGDDTVNDLSVTLTTDATASSAVGSVYTISGADNDETDNYTVTVTAGTLTITAKQLTWNADGVIAKTYDGTTAVAASDITTAPSLNGVISSDDVTVSAGTVTFDSATVGSTSVSVTGYTITGDDAGNYTTPTAQPTFTASIVAADYTLTVSDALQVKVGSGTAALSAVSVSVAGVNSETPIGAISYTLNGADLADTDISALAVGDTLTIDWAYTLGSDAVNGNYVTAAKTGTITITIVEGDPQYLTFTDASKAVTYGDVGFTNAIASVTDTDGYPVVDGGAITYASDNTSVAMVDATTGEVTIVGAGTATITATAAAVPGIWAQGSASYTVSVAARTPILSDFSITVPSDTQYTGSAVAASVSADSGIFGMGEITVRYNDEAVAPTDVGDYTVTFDVAAGTNYAAVTGMSAGSFSITQADAPTLSTMDATVYYAEAQSDVSIDLSQVAGLPTDAGDVIYYLSATLDQSGILSTSAITDGVLTISTNAMETEGDTATITVRVIMDNYETVDFDVVITTADKYDATISGIDVLDKVYDGNSASYTGTTVADYDYAGSFEYSWSDGTTVLDAAPVDVGSYSMTVSIPDSCTTHRGSVTISFEITPATLVISPASQSIYNGDALPTTFTLSYNGLVTGDTIEMAGTAVYTIVDAAGAALADSATDGTYSIVLSGATFSHSNYEITTADGTLTISTKATTTTSTSSSSEVTITEEVTVEEVVEETTETTDTVTASSPAVEPVEEEEVVETTTTTTTTTESAAEEVATEETESDTASESVVSVAVEATTEGTVATASVDEAAMETAVAQALAAAEETDAAPVVELAVDMPADAESVSVTLATETLAALAEHPDATLTLTTSVGTITLDSATIAGLVDQADGAALRMEITPVEATALNATQQEVVGDALVYDLSVYLGDVYISNFEGEVVVALPYTLKDGETADGVQVYYLDDMGNIEEMVTTYDSTTQTAQFTTTHFSVYVVSHAAVETSGLPVVPMVCGAVFVLALLAFAILIWRKREQTEED